MSVKRKTSLRDRHRAAIRHALAPCALCGAPIDYTLPSTDPKSFVVDHIIPVSRGGADTMQNKQAAHRDCNRAKSDRPIPPVIRRSGVLAR